MPNNSMTFVSNSFLAKRDYIKKTRDKSCSPVPILHESPQYDNYEKRSHLSVNPYSNQSQVLQGPVKRMLKEGLKSSRKKRRPSLSHLQSMNQYPSNPQNLSSSSFIQSEISEINHCSNLSYMDVNVKKEIVDSDEQNYLRQQKPLYAHNEIEPEDVFDMSHKKHQNSR